MLAEREPAASSQQRACGSEAEHPHADDHEGEVVPVQEREVARQRDLEAESRGGQQAHGEQCAARRAGRSDGERHRQPSSFGKPDPTTVSADRLVWP